MKEKHEKIQKKLNEVLTPTRVLMLYSLFLAQTTFLDEKELIDEFIEGLEGPMGQAFFDISSLTAYLKDEFGM